MMFGPDGRRLGSRAAVHKAGAPMLIEAFLQGAEGGDARKIVLSRHASPDIPLSAMLVLAKSLGTESG
jgi:hypothetical protein